MYNIGSDLGQSKKHKHFEPIRYYNLYKLRTFRNWIYDQELREQILKIK